MFEDARRSSIAGRSACPVLRSAVSRGAILEAPYDLSGRVLIGDIESETLPRCVLAHEPLS